MKPNPRSVKILREFAPQLERFSLIWKVWVSLLAAVILFGLYGLYVQITEGHESTGMRDHVVWGLYIANFIFFIGISYAGAVISGILHLLKVEWRRPIIRIAELITVIATIIGPIYILLCVGRLDRLHHLVIYPRLQSPITWDVLAISTYLVGSIIFLYLALIKDFALYRDSEDLKIGSFRRRVYSWLSLGYKGLPEQRKQLSISMNLMAIIIIPLAIIVHSVLSWIFGMTLRPGWHSTIFGPYFVLAAIYSGTGVLLVVMWVYRKIFNLYEYIEDKHFIYLGFIMLILAAAYGYFTFSEYLTDWYGSEKWNSELIHKLFSLEHYGWHFLYANIVGILIPILVMAIPATRKPKWIVISAFFMVTALWVKRYLIVVPTLETPLIPMQDLRPEYIDYSATWVEWSLTAAGIATFLLFFSVICKFVTVIPVTEILGEKDEESVTE